MLKAPFPWFGGKSRVAHLVWERFGEVKNYVEPFFGSGAVLLGRPDYAGQTETVNDVDGYVCNFWRAVQADPEAVAYHAHSPAFENDLQARNFWLAVRRGEVRERLEGDPDWYDAKIAGWWVWGICLWIGAEFAVLNGPWKEVDGCLVKGEPGEGVYRNRPDGQGMGINGRSIGTKRNMPNLGDYGRGVSRKRIELNNHTKGIFTGVERKRPNLSAGGVAGREKFEGVERSRPSLGNSGAGVQRRLLHLSSPGQGTHSKARFEALVVWFIDLCERLFRVRVCSGDWKRVMGESVTVKHGLTGVFLDPPYEPEGRDGRCYVHDENVWAEVWPWALANGSNPLLRIALAGYEGEVGQQLVDAGWLELPWKSQGGYGAGMGKRGEANRSRERLWFSPHCLVPGRDAEQLDLLGGVG